MPAAPRFLMCRPEHFGVTYAINPWMAPDEWRRARNALAAQSVREWNVLRDTLAGLGATIDLVPAVPGQPDLVFTANAAVVLDRKALLARFRFPQRRGEERHFETAFRRLQADGCLDGIATLPESTVLEGAGDCVFDETRDLFWLGYGPRSDRAAAEAVRSHFGAGVVPLQLVDPRFYHMDTALCPLSRGEVLYVPSAFDAAGRTEIERRVAPEYRLEIGEADAVQFAANAVCVGDALVMPACSDALHTRLERRGYRVEVVPLESFRRSGGAAFCLTLRLDRNSAAMARAA